MASSQRSSFNSCTRRLESQQNQTHTSAVTSTLVCQLSRARAPTNSRPYMLGAGLLTYFLSKEIYIINHETISAACMATVIIYSVKRFGPDVAAFADKLNEEKLQKAEEVKALAVASLAQAIEDEKKEQWRVEGRHLLFDAKRNNVAMLLETNWRERVHTVHNEVKKRLDYQIALQSLHRRMEQEHMVSWVEKNVVSSITPQQEKTSIAKCITDLKSLAKIQQAKATV
uniref:ATP synthase subunit b n=1 Tax=Esox lucius TaxID=8010 RepID=A0A3P8YLT9_ESOLU